MRIFKLFVLVPLALVVVAVLLSLVPVVMSMFPGWLSAVAVAVFVVAGAWFFFGRGNSAGGSESSLLGRSRPSKEGLL